MTLLLDLLPAEDVEPYLYTESRMEESLSQRDITRQVTPGRAIARSLGAGEFGICGIRKTTNGTMLITVTNGLDAAEVYAYTVAHTSSVVVATWTNEYDEVITSTNVIWHPVSPPFNGIQSDWASRATNLVLTGGTGVWEDTNISSNDRVRFYAVANRGDQDGDGLSDGAEILLHRTNLQSLDTDGDGLLDGYDISVQMGDPRYSLWANQGILYSESTGMRLFRGELSAGSSPLDDDTDGDGLPDGWEVQNDLDPLDAEGDNGPEGDPDGDEFDNALERELGAPANNAAWNGNELAYRLMHATPVVVTNTRSITTNLIGMRVTVENSWDCETGGHPGIQNNTHDLDIPALLECGYYIDIHVEGSVEAVDLHYDQVSFEAVTNNLYFSSHDDVGQPEYCLMADEAAEKNNLIFANSTVKLRYNTAGYRWHSDAFAEIIYATNTGPYKVVVSGADVICVGETAQMEASGAAGAPYTWSANGDISVGTNGVVTGLAPGIATVIATDAGGCSGEKEIIVILKVEIEEPDGLPIQAIQGGDSYFRVAAPWCFEWQYVHVSNEVVAYHTSQIIDGRVEPMPPGSYSWVVDAGTLSNPNTETPTYIPNNMAVPATMATVDLELQPLVSNDICRCTRQLEVYRDHLERDHQNFGTGISCGFNWNFTRYAQTISMGSTWNCHGSTRHCYDGTYNDANTGQPWLSWNVKAVVVVTHDSQGNGTHPGLGTLERGDVVAYFSPNGMPYNPPNIADLNGWVMQHSQTCTGNSTETYGANNEPKTFPGAPGDGQSWEWATSPAGDWANHVWQPQLQGLYIPFIVVVFDKP